MAVRPTVTHLIGISGLAKIAFDEEIKKFPDDFWDEEFLVTSKNVWKKMRDSEYFEEIKEGFGDVGNFQVFENIGRGKEGVFGIKPITSFEESHLFNHDLVWCMIEAGILDDKTKIIKLPYEDFSKYIGLPPRELIQYMQVPDGLVIQNYEGKWARKYQNRMVNVFDDDFDFAYEMFHELNMKVKPKDLDRFLIIDWS